MEKIDRLVWADGLSFRAYGVRVGIRTSKPDILDRLLHCLPPGWKPSSSPVVERLYSIIAGGEGPRPGTRLLNIVYADASRIARTPELHQAADALESDLQIYVAEAAPRRLFVHAGVVGWQGQAVVIPGRSFSGKTSLVAAFVKAGAVYYSDEYAVLDARGLVHHYARPLSIREHGHLERPKKYSIEALGGRAGVKPLPVGLVVVSQYTPGARWRPRRLSAGEGALALLANTVSVRRQPQRTLATLHEVVARAPVLEGSRGEAGQVVDSILKGLGG